MSELKFAPGLKEMLAREVPPGYMTNVMGSKVSVNSIGAAYAMADLASESSRLFNQAEMIYNAGVEVGVPLTGDFMASAKASKMKMRVQLARQLSALAALCDYYNLPTTIQSDRMAKANLSLSATYRYVTGADGKKYIETTREFRTTDDWRVFVRELNTTAINEQSPDLEGTSITMSGTQRPSIGMGLAVLAAAVPALATTAQVGTAVALATTLLPVILIIGVVVAVGVIAVGAYSIKLAIGAWSAHDAAEQDMERQRLTVQHDLMKEYVNCDEDATPDKCRRLREMLDIATAQVDKDLDDNSKGIVDKFFGEGAGNILMLGGILIGGYIAYSLVKEFSSGKSNKQLEG
jgi:hypothetical protein